MQIINETYLDYSDILIQPKLGNNLDSRSKVVLNREYKFKHGQQRTGLGIFNANMSTVGNFDTAVELLSNGMLATIHKHYTVHEICQFVWDIDGGGTMLSDNLFISIGIKDSEKEILKLKELYSKIPNMKQNICIDAPNFYVPKALNCLKEVRKTFPDSVIMCGNVASKDILYSLFEYSDIVKLGIGSGSACTTRKQTGCGVPMVSLLLDCVDVAHSVNGHICADGGIVDIGDISKAFCLNADFVMIGGMFAGTDEAKGEIIEKYFKTNEVDSTNAPIYKTKYYKEYIGMSSTKANNLYAGGMQNYKTAEGRELEIPYTGSLYGTLKNIKGGIASCCTYIGANKVKYMPKCATIIKVNNQLNKVFERYEKEC